MRARSYIRARAPMCARASEITEFCEFSGFSECLESRESYDIPIGIHRVIGFYGFQEMIEFIEFYDFFQGLKQALEQRFQHPSRHPKLHPPLRGAYPMDPPIPEKSPCGGLRGFAHCTMGELPPRWVNLQNKHYLATPCWAGKRARATANLNNRPLLLISDPPLS